MSLSIESVLVGTELRSAGALPPLQYPEGALAHFHSEDLSFLTRLLSDPTVSWYEPLEVSLPDPGGAEIVESFLAKQLQLVEIDRAPGSESWTRAWLVFQAGRKVGSCQLRPEEDGCLVGASLMPQARGRGLGSAIFSALAVHAYALGATHVAGEAETDNLPSLRALEKAGYTSVARYRLILANQRGADVVRYQI